MSAAFSKTIDLPDFSATERFAATMAPLLASGDVLALEGKLGAGKTAFARLLLQALGVTGEVASPTFTLVQTYDVAEMPICHFDLYRLKGEEELEELGWDDALSNGLVIAEWPQRAGSRLPDGCLHINFEIMERGQRRCVIEGDAAWAARLSGVPL